MGIGMRRTVECFVALTVALSLAACGISVNDDVEVPADSERRGAVNTVNGNIRIGERARVEGDLRSVNGEIDIGRGASVGGVTSVNGAVRIAAGAALGALRVVNGGVEADDEVEVDGNASVVNGGLRLGPGGSIAGDATCVTGGVRLAGVRVGGDVVTVTGEVALSGATRVLGQVRVEADEEVVNLRVGDPAPKPRVVIGAGVVVEGGVRFEREGVLWVHEEARMSGPIEGVTAQSFRADSPPDVS